VLSSKNCVDVRSVLDLRGLARCQRKIPRRQIRREGEGTRVVFPSIERTYGRPIGEWQEMIRVSDLKKHMDLVNWLKTEHGMGHGHANALVGYTLAEDRGDH
jgi:hypothetical protein